jgi:hypothetical protein
MAGLDPAIQTLPRVEVLVHRLKADDGEILGEFQKNNARQRKQSLT